MGPLPFQIMGLEESCTTRKDFFFFVDFHLNNYHINIKMKYTFLRGGRKIIHLTSACCTMQCYVKILFNTDPTQA